MRDISALVREAHAAWHATKIAVKDAEIAQKQAYIEFQKAVIAVLSPQLWTP